MSSSEHTSNGIDLSTDFQIGGWLVRPSLRRMERDGEVHALGQRLCHLLCCLRGTPGEVVTREALLDAIWGDTAIAEEGLTVAVSELRRLLGDDPQQPHFIETIRGVGYRLVCPVRSGSPVPTTASGSARSSRPFDLLPLLPRSRALMVGAAILLAAAVAVVFWPRQPPHDNPTADVVPLTSMPGAEVHPAVSPTSEQVVFAADQGTGLDLYLVQPGADAPVRLSFDDGDEDWPAISPDGQTVAFTTARREPGVGDTTFGIATVPVAGGTPRRLITTSEAVHGLSFAPDGSRLAYAMGTAVWILDLISMQSTALPNGGSTEPAREPSFSPDGLRIAFVSGTLQLNHVYVQWVDRGWMTRVALSQRNIAGVDWSSDGTSVIFAAAPAGQFQLWRAKLADGSLARLPGELRDARHPSVGRQRGFLVYQEMRVDSDIWRVRLSDPGDDALHAESLICSTRLDGEAHSSPNGEQIAFVSARSGHRELWTADAGGGGQRRITDLGGSYLSHPRWSPDGRRIAFTAISDRGVPHLWVVEPATGDTRQVSHSDERLVLEEWREDGEALYAVTPAVGGWKVVSVAIDGGEQHWVLPVGSRLVGTLGNRDLLYVDAERNLLRRRRAADGELVDVATLPTRWHEVLLRRDMVVVVSSAGPDRWQIDQVDLETGGLDRIGALEGISGEQTLNPDLTPDGRWLLFDHHQGELRSDLMLLRGQF